MSDSAGSTPTWRSPSPNGAAAQLLPGPLEAGVDHAVDGGLDRGLLHAHEVGERVVEIEDDCSDHASLAPGRTELPITAVLKRDGWFAPSLTSHVPLELPLW